jgi:hypothetical protein
VQNETSHLATYKGKPELTTSNLKGGNMPQMMGAEEGAKVQEEESKLCHLSPRHIRS